MSLLNILGITDALADAAPAAAGANSPGSLLSLLPTLIIFVLIFYFLLIRPQAKRAKDHRRLMESLAVDDEVVTTGGMVGKIARMADDYVILQTGNNEVTFQRAAIAMVLPKGTIKSV